MFFSHADRGTQTTIQAAEAALDEVEALGLVRSGRRRRGEVVEGGQRLDGVSGHVLAGSGGQMLVRARAGSMRGSLNRMPSRIGAAGESHSIRRGRHISQRH